MEKALYLQGLLDSFDHRVVFASVELDDLDGPGRHQLPYVFQTVIDEDADGRDRRVQGLAQGCGLVVADAALLAGKDETGIIGPEFIGPGNITGPLEAAELDLNHDSLRPARRAWLSYRDCA